MKEEKYIDIAERWLNDHYPDKQEPIDVRYSAVINFAAWLDRQNENN